MFLKKLTYTYIFEINCKCDRNLNLNYKYVNIYELHVIHKGIEYMHILNTFIEKILK
jgi:hypothetical protein